MEADKEHTNSIGMEFVLIPAGEFMRGCYTVQYRVTISKAFYLGKYAVTQTQWMAVMESNPSKFEGRNNPVEMVSWYDAQTFITHLNEKEGHKRYRLPTEAEWEYAARAGSDTKYGFGDDVGQHGQYTWVDNSGDSTTHPVGQKQPNAWGLYDMHGNVWEWVQDWYGDYPERDVTDPGGPLSGSTRVRRGDCWDFAARLCRSAFRDSASSGYRNGYLGFRLALSPE